MFYSGDKLYVVERETIREELSHPLGTLPKKLVQTHVSRLVVYQINNGTMKLIDRMKLEHSVFEPNLPVCVDQHSQRIFVSHGMHGIFVACLDQNQLSAEKILRCVEHAICVDVMSLDTLYVYDMTTRSVHIVDIRADRIIETLKKSSAAPGMTPARLAVVGDSVVVDYFGTLVVYHHGNVSPVKVISHHEILETRIIGKDNHGHILLASWLHTDDPIHVMDADGNLIHSINHPKIDPGSGARSCAVVNRQLWLGCFNGEIIILSKD